MCKSLKFEGLETRKLMTADIGMSIPVGEVDQVEACQVGGFERSEELIFAETGQTENRHWDTGGTAEPPVIYTNDKGKEDKVDHEPAQQLEDPATVEATDGYQVDSFTLNYSKIDV